MPLFSFGKSTCDEVREFHSSPFNNEHLKFSRLLSFHMDNEEYKVGDFVLLRDDTNNIYQIRTLGYKKSKDLHPELVFTAFIFSKASVFYSENRGFEKPGSLSRFEYVKLDETTISKPQHISEVVTLLPYEKKKRGHAHEFYCRYSVQ